MTATTCSIRFSRQRRWMKFNVRIGTPKGFEPETEFVDMARAAGSIVTLTNDADEAIAGADVVVTDTWVSMGQDHVHNKLAAMAPFQVSQRLMAEPSRMRSLPSLPPRACRRRSNGRGLRRSAIGGLRRGGESHSRPEVGAVVVFRQNLTGLAHSNILRERRPIWRQWTLHPKPPTETLFRPPAAFTIPARHARGRLVRLDETLDVILAAHDYPPRSPTCWPKRWCWQY